MLLGSYLNGRYRLKWSNINYRSPVKLYGLFGSTYDQSGHSIEMKFFITLWLDDNLFLWGSLGIRVYFVAYAPPRRSG